MGNNNYRPCVYVVPEDDANRQIVDGFCLDYRITGQIQVLPNAGGWSKVIKTIETEYFSILRKYPNVHVLGLIDCDNEPGRIQRLNKEFPTDVRDRIFLLGTLPNPEAFKSELHLTFEGLGEMLAEDCASGNEEIWKHKHLEHIQDEIARAKEKLRSVLWPI